MDEMNIITGFTTKLISKIIRKIVREKAGYEIDIFVNKINVSINDGKAHIHLDADAEIGKEELLKIVKKAGLG